MLLIKDEGFKPKPSFAYQRPQHLMLLMKAWSLCPNTLCYSWRALSVKAPSFLQLEDPQGDLAGLGLQGLGFRGLGFSWGLEG